MIEVHVPEARRHRGVGRWLNPRIIAVFSFRYDAHLVPALIENISPLVDGWVCWDDREATQVFSSETARRHLVIEAAHDAGADWVLAVDPDERFEASVADKIRRMVRVPGPVCWTFELKELYTPTAYRTDGIWGRKRQRRLFPIFDNQFPIKERGTFQSRPLHGVWAPEQYFTLHSRLNLYHLKMIDAGRRRARSALYSALDPLHEHQAVGYAYLADDTGAKFEEIPPGRSYEPPHADDGGLWMADPGSVVP